MTSNRISERLRTRGPGVPTLSAARSAIVAMASLALAGSLASPLGAQTTFVEVASSVGMDAGYQLTSLGFGFGAAAADFDDDGDIDVFAPTAEGSGHLLYRNLGSGQFEEVAASLGLAGHDRARVALWFDYDGDHRLDLLVGIDCFESDCAGIDRFLRLYRQTEAGSFVEVTASAGLLDPGHDNNQHRSGMAAADVTGNGYLDFVAGFWNGRLDLYVNQGDGTFVRTTAASGLETEVRSYHQPLMHDLDGDGLVDIYAAVDFTENQLWRNQGLVGGVPTFVDVADAAGCDNAMNDMGAALGDLDADGDPDLYVTNIHRLGFHNVLLRNDSAGGSSAYAETSAAAGVQDVDAWGWGTTAVDFDNDGHIDLAATNGWRTSAWHDPPRLFVNQGDSPPTFVDQAPSSGLTDRSWGAALVAIDHDRDGDMDLFETIPEIFGAGNSADEVRLHENRLDRPDRHSLTVRPRMAGPNHWAIGAEVVVELRIDGESRRLHRWIGAGTSYLGQEPAEAFFGLGSAERVDRLTVHWPDGRQTISTDMAADQVHTIDDQGLFANGFESGDMLRWSSSSP